MKSFNILIGALVLLSNVAVAAPMFCRGGKFTVSVSSNHKRADVYENNKPAMFGALGCVSNFTMVFRPEGSPVLACKTIQPVADAGLSIYLFRPHNTNKLVGTLTTQTIAGPRKLTDLTCVHAMHFNE